MATSFGIEGSVMVRLLGRYLHSGTQNGTTSWFDDFANKHPKASRAVTSTYLAVSASVARY
jgi:hypothetical protein